MFRVRKLGLLKGSCGLQGGTTHSREQTHASSFSSGNLAESHGED